MKRNRYSRSAQRCTLRPAPVYFYVGVLSSQNLLLLLYLCCKAVFNELTLADAAFLRDQNRAIPFETIAQVPLL